MSGRIRRQPDSERGFVLVGVVMMVLALTILGLSLFSLSTYEAQFLEHSIDSQQALQCALGGIDRARYALIAKDQTLAQVHSGLPIEHVYYARATQRQGIPPVPDSSGSVDWSGDVIHIESYATVNGVTRTAEADYIPHQTINWYSRLMTISNSASADLTIPLFDSSTPTPRARTQVSLSDSLWLGASITGWEPGVIVPPPHPVIPQVPVPAAPLFIASHSAIQTTPPPAANLTFHAPPDGPPTYWYTDTHQSGFSYYDVKDGVAANHQIHVTGRVVWCLPQGVRFDNPVEVISDGDPNACLVIVASNGYDGQPVGTRPYDHYGAIWFFSGLISSQVPIILVSDGHVKIEAGQVTGATTDVEHLSIFANDVFLMGPTTSPVGPYMTLNYGNRATMKSQLDFLFSFGALPNSSAPSSQQLTLRPGTWRITQ